VRTPSPSGRRVADRNRPVACSTLFQAGPYSPKNDQFEWWRFSRCENLGLNRRNRLCNGAGVREGEIPGYLTVISVTAKSSN